MSKAIFLSKFGIGIISSVFCAFFAVRSAAGATLTPPIRQSDGMLGIAINGSSGEQVTLQGSANVTRWNDLQTYQLDGSAVVYEQAPNGANYQFFRLKTVANNPGGGATLPSLSDSVDSVFVAGEGFDTVQFAPNGTLGFIFWKGRELMIRERNTSGGWSEQVVSDGGNSFQKNASWTDYKFQPAALLLYDSNSQPHVFKVNGGKTIAHLVRNGANWSQAESIQNNAANADVSMLVGAIGNGNVFHLAAVSAGDSPNLTYASNRNGSWNWTSISSVGPIPSNYLPPSYAARWLSLAVDANNVAHLVFRPEQRVGMAGGYIRPYNELAYAWNKSGQWNVQVIHKPQDDSAEVGSGLSIAIGPDNKPYIASWYNERGDGGSSQYSRLLFHSQDGAGNWTRAEVISRPDGYMAGDGEKGTGAAAYLRFDARGRPHILFLDHGSEHFPVTGQIEFAGNIRHAYLHDGQWQVETIYRQAAPQREQIVYPAFAMNGSELVVTGLKRETDWNMNVWPPTVNSRYRFEFVTAPLR